MKNNIRYLIHAFYFLLRLIKSKIGGRLNKLRGYAIFGRKNVIVYPHVEMPNKGVVCEGNNVIIHANVRLECSEQSLIRISNNVEIFDHSVIQSLGGEISIGQNVIIGEYTTIQAQASVIIEDDVLLASKIQIISNCHVYEDIRIPIKYQQNISKPIIIKKGAWIGINTTLLSGVTIGRNSVIGAGSVVNRDVPDYTVVGGTPARVLKKYNIYSGVWETYK